MKRPLIFCLASKLTSILTLGLIFAAGATSAQEGQLRGRGFSPEKVYDVGKIDAVNLFNGNLTLTIPIGSRYPGGGEFSYGLTLVNNAKVWNYTDRVDPVDPTKIYRVASPYPEANAGLGWLLTLGLLYSPQTAIANETDQWLYVAPDGGEHLFYDTLHEGESVISGYRYTRDGSYIRFKDLGAQVELEFPDGMIKKFQLGGNCPRPGTAWRLIQIRDRSGNELNLTCDSGAGKLTLADNHGRQHVLHFVDPRVADPAIDTNIDMLITLVEVEAFDSTSKASYGFEYTNTYIERGCHDTDPTNDFEVKVPLLKRVTMPEGESYEMLEGGQPRYLTDCSATSGRASGKISGIRLPTGGQIEWDYTVRSFPTVDMVNSSHAIQDMARTSGVGIRRELDPTGVELGTWHYAGEHFPPPPWIQGDRTQQPREIRVHVTHPSGHCTKHYFGANPGWGIPGQDSVGGWDFGLPFTWEASSSGMWLSSEVFASHDAATFRCTGSAPIRSRYVLYEHDKPGSTHGDTNEHLHNTNRRLTASRTVYHDDGDRFAEATSDDFDGLGHFREAVTGGNFDAGNVRDSFTKYNDGVGTYDWDIVAQAFGSSHSFTMLPTSAPWVLGTFTEGTVTEGDTAREEYCFDADDGFLLRRRTLAGTSQSGKDLLAVFTKTGSGQVKDESYYGGDGAGLASGALCSIGLPSGAPSYKMSHSYQFGALRRSVYLDQTGAEIPFSIFDATIDQNTALVATSRDSSGQIETIFDYDKLGRLTSADPEVGEGATTTYDYTPYSPGNPAKVTVTQTGWLGLLAESEFEFDGFGRIATERRLMEGGLPAERATTYDEAGRKATLSEWGNLSSVTEFLDYDEFDRPGRIKAPDNAEVSFAYQGVRVVDRTVEIAKSAGATDVTTRETYDRQGRLYQVQEPQGTGAAFTYTYDEGGRLAQVHTDPSGANNEQTRSFAYDGRGFLLSESHPEKIAAVTYSGYDARGQVGRKVDGPNILDFTYDRAERLTRIDGWDGAVKEYRYDDSSPSTSLRLNGRLREAVRHNWVDLAGDDADLFIDVAVTETYAYEGVGGRVSSRTTVTSENDLQFHQTFVYDGIGQVTEIGYPVCLGSIDCPANDVTRTIENVYANGWLTAVGETGDMGKYAQSITYHPNGLWSAITRPSGVQDIQDVASHGMRRPERIQVTGVAGGTAFDTGLYTYDGAGNIAAMGLDSFEYDSSSRLSAAEVHGYAQSFTYDWYGNLTSYITDGDVTSIPTDPMTNRIANPALATYDAAGNMTSLSGHTYEYDELNQLVSRDPDLGANQDSLWSAIYTADDERLAVWEVEAEDSGWEARWTLRGLDGKVLRQYAFSRSGAGESIFEDGFESGDLCAWTDDSGSGPTCRSHGWFWERDHVYRDGQLLAEVGELNVLHRHVDHLGSLRQVTDEQGIWQEDHAYLPFGEEVPASSRVPLQFTGHERDSHGAGSADDLDYMHARYCSPTMGRFLSVDPVSSSSPRKPQSWNKYAYALDNPIKFLDPDGRTVVGFYGSGGSTIGGVGAALDALIPHTAAVGGVRGFYGGFYPPSGVEEAVSFITSDRRRAPETSLVLFGHSRGAVSALKTARLLAQGGDSAAVDLLVTADPALNLPGSRVVPPNVRTAINFFQLSLGVNLRGDTLRAADPSRTNVFNIQLDATHTGIDEAVAQAIVSFVLDLAASGQLGHLEEGLQFLQGQLINVMAE